MTDVFLTVRDVADTLKLNQQTIRNWMDQGALSYVRLGRRIRIRQSDLDQFIQAGIPTPRDTPHPPDAPPAIDANRPDQLWAQLYTQLSDAHAAKAAENPADTATALRALSHTAIDLADALDQPPANTDAATPSPVP